MDNLPEVFTLNSLCFKVDQVIMCGYTKYDILVLAPILVVVLYTNYKTVVYCHQN